MLRRKLYDHVEARFSGFVRFFSLFSLSCHSDVKCSLNFKINIVRSYHTLSKLSRDIQSCFTVSSVPSSSHLVASSFVLNLFKFLHKDGKRRIFQIEKKILFNLFFIKNREGVTKFCRRKLLSM